MLAFFVLAMVFALPKLTVLGKVAALNLYGTKIMAAVIDLPQTSFSAKREVVFLLPCSFYIGKSNPARAGGNAAGDGAVRRALARSTRLGVRRASGLGQEGLRRGPAHQSKVVGLGSYRIYRF